MKITANKLIALVLPLALIGCQPSDAPQTQSSATYTPEAIAEAAKQIDNDSLMNHIQVLASDEFEGRAPSTPGGRKTVEYLEAQFSKLGLLPAFGEGDNASFRQSVPLIEQTVTNNPALNLSYPDGEQSSFAYREESMAWTARVTNESVLEDSPLVFVGYGVVAPEYGWNDYAGVDMSGKTAVILVNDPGYRAPQSELFKGLTMTYYGRWRYKFEEAARQGAEGAIIVHETGAAGYGWAVVSGSWSGAQYMLFAKDGNKDRVAVEGWITESAAQDLFAKNDLDYNELVEQAGAPGFKPIELTTTASTRLEMTSRESESFNVASKIAGQERPDEAFIYTAHWDHLGVKPSAEGDDKTYNGAQDNATGVAGLFEIAEAFLALPNPPQRSVIFLAVTAEESGLLGSQQYAEDPAVAMNKTVGGINMDSIAAAGATDDIVVVGYGNSQMDDYLKEAAATQGRHLVQEPTPEKGFFYRSDHFNLAKKGVPMLYAKAGIMVRDQPEGYGEQQSARYIAERYHKPGDEIHAEWDSGGILQDLDVHFKIGAAISDSNDWPQWSQGNEFEAIREASMAE